MKNSKFWVLFLVLFFVLVPALGRGEIAQLSSGVPARAINPEAQAWAHQNIRSLNELSPEFWPPIYYIISIFYARIANWREYQPFYDRLYFDTDFAKKYPVFVDPSEGPFIAIMLPGQKLTDFSAYSSLRGKTVEEVFGYPGDRRLMDTIEGEGTRLTLILQSSVLTNQIEGAYNTFYHEFGHFLHFSLMTEQEFNHVERLYRAAIEKNLTLDNYAALNPMEYFAQGLEAYLSVSKSGASASIAVYKSTRADLERKDPDLFAFIRSLVDAENSTAPAPDLISR